MPRKSKKVQESSEGSSEHDAAEPKTKKSKKQAEEPAVYVDPPDKVKNAKGKPATLKITSWNVDGLRAWVKKNALEWVTKDSPDILCLQEVKCSAENVPAAVRDLEDFPHQFWSTGVREGLHGVGLLCKEKPLKVTYGIDMKEFDEEGRAITAEFDSFILVMAYVPNSGRGLVRLDDRERWDETFCKHLKALQEDKPLVVCGDFNVAYEEIDLKNPKSNKDRTPGFTQRERDGFGRLLDIGLVDSFRKLYPDVQYAYTFWTYMMNARAKNVGWRLDYFLLSNDLMSALCDSKIRSDVRGSDHCPISLRLAM